VASGQLVASANYDFDSGAYDARATIRGLRPELVAAELSALRGQLQLSAALRGLFRVLPEKSSALTPAGGVAAEGIPPAEPAGLKLMPPAADSTPPPPEPKRSPPPVATEPL